MLEVEKLIERETDILCLTETQLKYDKYILSRGLTKVESFREMNDRKGGGLLLMYNTNKVTVNKKDTRHPDIMVAEVIIRGFKLNILLVYMSVSDEQRNSIIKRNIEEELGRIENEEPLILLGDMNGHVGFLGSQRLNKNGQIILDLLNRYDLTLLNDVIECEGTYTWSVGNKKSVIDYCLINNKFSDKYVKMSIDENKINFDLSDNNLITTEFRVNAGKPKYNNTVNKVYIDINDNTKEKFLEELNKLDYANIDKIESLEKNLTIARDNSMQKTIKVKVNKSEK